MRRTFKWISCIVTMALVLMQFNIVMADEQMESATDLAGHINVGWNLGNTFDAYGTWINGTSPDAFETAWGNVTTTKAMIDSVKEQGFNTIRIPITWAQHIDGNGNIDEAWLARVKEVVDYAYEDGLYVIINTHHDGGEHGGDKVAWLVADTSVYESTKTKFAALWTNIANTFKDYDDRLIFEGYNELIDSNRTWDQASTGNNAYDAVNSYAQLFVDTVRATGGNNAERNLIVQTYVGSWNQTVLDSFVVPSDSAEDHLICAVHSYTPWGFTGTNATVNWTPVHNDFGDSDRNEIDGCVDQIAAFRDRIGIPVIIGEFGAENKCNEDQIELYVSYLVDRAGQAGIKCLYWDNGIFNDGSGSDGYAIFNRASLTWKDGITSSMLAAAEPYVTEAAEEIPETSETTEATTASETAISSEETQGTDASSAIPEESLYETEEIVEGGTADQMPVILIVFIAIDILAVAAFFTLLAVYLNKKKNGNGSDKK
ncbi:MAG: glycoside hydrolase family 5 protein [Saccharofermentans sp.]|nr:glycoside hydrolase family 5 protein [Saccharofermentans sp.]